MWRGNSAKAASCERRRQQPRSLQWGYAMESVLVSACLLGHAVRYDGEDMFCDHPLLKR